MDGPTKIGAIGGFEVTADWSVAVSFVLLTGYLAVGVFPLWHPQWSPLISLLTAFGTAVLLVASVLVRGLAQALVGRRAGADIRTLELFPFGGIPHATFRPAAPGTELRMAMAGPLASLLLGMLSFGLASAEATPGSTILLSLGWLNVALCAINLLPGYPLDGGRALRALLWAWSGDRNRATQASCRLGQACGWALIVCGIGVSFGVSLPVLDSAAGGPWLMLIGWFLIRAAVTSYRSTLLADICRELAALDALIDVPVTAVMSRAPSCMRPTDEFRESRNVAPREQVLVPIEADGRFLGWLRREDLAGPESEDLHGLQLAERMIPVDCLPTVRPEQTIAEAVTLMNRCCLDHIPVLVQERLIGIVSREDVVTWMCREAQAIRIERSKFPQPWRSKAMQRRGIIWIAVLATVASAVAFATLSAQAAEPDAVIHKEVAQAMTEAKKQVARKHWDAALAALSKAERSPQKTDYAEFKIQEFKAYILTQQRKYAQAAPIFAKLGASEQASAQQRQAHLKTAAQLYLSEKQYQKAADAAQSALQLSPSDPQLLELAGQSRYMSGDFAGAAHALEQLLSRTRKLGKTPEEDWLQLLLNAYYKLGDEQKIASAWEALLRYYPKQEYWRNVLARRTAQELSPALELGYRRLMYDVGLLKEPKDYEELAMNAIEAGAPEEAVRILSSGLESGVLAGERARFERMLGYARDRAAKSEAGLAQLSKDAARASSGELSVTLGRAYLGQQQYDRAIAALRRGLSKGKLKDPGSARILLGIAYLKKQQPKQAREALAAVDANSEWHDLAELWSLRAESAERS